MSIYMDMELEQIELKVIWRQKQIDYFESIGKPYFDLDPYINEAVDQIYAENRPNLIPDSLEEIYSYAIRVAEKTMFVQL